MNDILENQMLLETAAEPEETKDRLIKILDHIYFMEIELKNIRKVNSKYDAQRRLIQ